MTMAELFPTLTKVRCDCCGEWFVDEVGLMVVEDAIREYHDELLAKARRDANAWADAERRTREALEGRT